ncbi:hypothetical protein [Bdellovibrio sp. NC01]|uniref:hypothetical protein n=1 Tax=Bdellovibrio sp. NC01 TaxID=2220073 RepID=UPI0011579F54|nr:hypothetical protein [Bdellovibrio sp. NC01]QDK37927.1 hypothetical protein DOE51_10190 [Bdellovibrio sp. NC01]
MFGKQIVLLITSLLVGSAALALDPAISVSCVPSCLYFSGQTPKVRVKNVPVSIDNRLTVKVEGIFDSQAVQLQKSGKEYIYQGAVVGSEGFAKYLDISVYAVDESKENAYIAQISSLGLRVAKIDELLQSGPNSILETEKSKLQAQLADLNSKKVNLRSVIYSTSVKILARPIVESSIGILSLGGVIINDYNDLFTNPVVSVTGVSLSNKYSDFTVFLNGVVLQTSEFFLNPNSLIVQKKLVDGENTIRFYGYDNLGKPLFAVFKFWAGSKSKVITLKDVNGTPVENATANINAVGSKVSQSLMSDSTGRIFITNFPANMMLNYQAYVTNGFAAGTLASNIDTASVTLSTVGSVQAQNLNYNYDLSGWDLTSGQVYRAPITSDLSNFLIKPKNKIHGLERKTRKILNEKSIRVFEDEDCLLGQCSLILSTAGVGAKTTSHTFVATEKNLKINYRFKTLEIFNGYEDTEYDDTYTISYRSSSGYSNSISGSMRSLGRNAFDANALSQWMQFQIMNEIGDTVEIKLTVTNVMDDLYDSLLQIAPIYGSRLQLAASLNKDVMALSVGSSFYANGKTQVDGHVKVTGTPGDKLSDLKLNVNVAGVSLDGSLLNSASSIVGSFFPLSGILESDVTFEFATPYDFKLPEKSEATVSVEAISEGPHDDTAVLTIGKLPAIGFYYNFLDSRNTKIAIGEGGTEWVLPQVAKYVAYLEDNYSTFFTLLSPMNGGTPLGYGSEFGDAARYSPSWYNLAAAKNEVEAAEQVYEREMAATKLIELANDSANGSHILRIWADGRFFKTSGAQIDPFWAKINSDPVAASIIVPWPGYSSEFLIFFR